MVESFGSSTRVDSLGTSTQRVETYTLPGPESSQQRIRRVVTFCVVAIVLLVCGMIVMGVFLGLTRRDVSEDSSIRGAYPAVRAASTRPMLSSGTLFLTVPIVDGVRINTGDRVLLKNELNPQLNGIYVRAGDSLKRAPDMDRYTQVTPGNSVLVLEGVENGGASFMLFSLSAVMGPQNSVTGNGIVYKNTTGVALGSLIPPAPAAGYVLTYDEANPTTVKWVKSVTGTGSRVFSIVYQVDNSVGPGDIPLANQWVTRSVNKLFDAAGTGDVSVDADNKTFSILTPGVWYISASSPAYRCNQHKIRLIDADTGEELITGTSAYSVNTNPTDMSNSSLTYTWKVDTVPLVLSIQHKVQLVDTNTSFGIPSSFGVPEVYTNIQLIKTT